MSEQIYKVLSPFDFRPLGEFKHSTHAEIESCIEISQSGRERQQRLAPFERESVLSRLAELVEKNSNLIAETITDESGKTITDSKIEVSRAITTIRVSAQEAGRIEGIALHSDAVPPRRNRIGVVQWFPLGTVLAITPFNFPINIAAHKICPAYAAGNSIIFRPSPQNYLSSKIFTDLCHEAGMQEDILQMSNASNDDMETLIQHPQVTCVNFTGSVRVGKLIAKQSGMKKIIMELGGNDPLMVFPDADIDLAVDTTIAQRFGTAGQRCTAAKQILVHPSVLDVYTNLLLEKTSKLKVGNPRESDTDVGPLISSNAVEGFKNAISDAKSNGAKVLIGDNYDGNLVYPTVLSNVSRTCQIVCEEIFGPVAPIRTFADTDELIHLINAQSFGLQAGVFTQDINVAKLLHQKLEVATLAVNDGPGFRAEHFPFGGIKDSGLGNEGVAFAIREMSYRKTLVF